MNIVKNIIRNKMKIQYFSDIHLEFFRHHNDIEKVISKINRCADICVIAGDIGYPFQYSYDFFLKSISKIFKHTIIIHGNHEYYQIIKEQENKSIEDIKNKTKEICNKLNNVYFLDNSYIDLPDENNKIIEKIKGLVLLNPALNTSVLDREIPDNIEERRKKLWLFVKKLFDSNFEKFSPSSYIRKDLPPSIILHGKSDKTIPIEIIEKFSNDMIEKVVSAVEKKVLDLKKN